MDPFQQCVEDLGIIERLLELPHGYSVAEKMMLELTPYLDQLSGLKLRDPTGAIERVLEYSVRVRQHLHNASVDVRAAEG